MRLTLAFCRPKANCIPKKPRLILAICSVVSEGFVFGLDELIIPVAPAIAIVLVDDQNEIADSAAMLSHFYANVYFIHKYLPNSNGREFRPLLIHKTF